MKSKKKIKKKSQNKGKFIKDFEPDTISSNTKKPIFSFEYMVNNYCVDDCEQNEKASLADALYRRSKLTWAQLSTAPHNKLGYEPIRKLNVPLPKNIKEDVTIISFRFCGKKPMVGYRDKQIFYILFLDREFKVYDH